MYTIYAMIDPITSSIRYVGITDDYEKRKKDHLRNGTNRMNARKHEWIKTLDKKGIEPSFIILEKHESATTARLAERWWIAQGLRSGWALTNDGATECVQGDDIAEFTRVPQGDARRINEALAADLISQEVEKRIKSLFDEYVSSMKKSIEDEQQSKPDPNFSGSELKQIVALHRHKLQQIERLDAAINNDEVSKICNDLGVSFPTNKIRPLTANEKLAVRQLSALEQFQYRGEFSFNRMIEFCYGTKNRTTIILIKEAFHE
jgi:hypothetical protein